MTENNEFKVTLRKLKCISIVQVVLLVTIIIISLLLPIALMNLEIKIDCNEFKGFHRKYKPDCTIVFDKRNSQHDGAVENSSRNSNKFSAVAVANCGSCPQGYT